MHIHNQTTVNVYTQSNTSYCIYTIKQQLIYIHNQAQVNAYTQSNNS